MAAAPQVRDLNTLIATQQKALQPQLDVIGNDITANDASGAAQTAGIEAKKTAAFGGIDQAASDKGMFFSGFSPDEEAKYTAGTYLPALAQLQSTIAQTRSNLLGKKADLNKSAYDVATQQQEGDIKALQDWNKMTQEEQFNASESQKQRVFEAQQNQIKINAENSRAAADRAANTPTTAQKRVADIAAAHGFLQGVAGSDNYVSPTTYSQAKSLWAAEGYAPRDFDAQFAGYRNPNNPYYKLG